MDSILIIIAVSLAIASILNIVLTKFNISHIIGYIITGTLISNLFDFNGSNNLESLELIGEFGIVFLMFTIGLEMSYSKLKRMKELIFFNGFMQVAVSASLIFLVSFYVFNIDVISSIVVALAFSLSSTAIVSSYLKKSKDILTPYGEKSVAILIFQDIAVIPILLLISFLSNNDLSVIDVLIKTTVSATLIIIFMFTLGKKIIAWLLHFSASARMEELFLGSVLTIVIGASLLAHEVGFTYSLGSFIAGMIIAETNYHIKVESDISSYKDLLLGAFFFFIGTKIDIIYFAANVHLVFAVLILTMLIKAVVIYVLIRHKSNRSDALKTAFALCQIGEFSFAIFALAISQSLISQELGGFIILVSVLSMIITPFMVNNIYKLAAIFVTEFFEADKITPVAVSNHVVICGFATLGRIVAKKLERSETPFLIISDNLQHVLLARKRGYSAYFGHLEKLPVLESLKVDQASSVILTMNTLNTKKLICESVLNFNANAKLVVKINTEEEREALSGLAISHFVHAQHETAALLVKRALPDIVPV